jgi:TonB family protein
MTMNKMAIMLMVMAMMVSACQASAQNNRSLADTSDDIVDVDEQPVVMKQVQPKYPEAAQKAKLEGTVRLKLLVNKLGTVDTVIVKQPTPTMAELEKAAVEAARQWVFKPATKDGKPMAVWVTFPTTFVIKAKSKK